MALSLTSIANFLFKKNQGKSSTNDARQFFEEPIDGRPAVFPVQVWAQGDTIPATAPTLADQATSGVVKRYVNLQLTAVAGTSNAFSHASLKDCIPFNFGDGSYNYALTDSTGASIPFGLGDWIVDPAVGTVTFYGSVPGNMPPKISFFQYIGVKGLTVSTGGPATSAAFAEQTSDPAAPASGSDLLYFKTGGILYSINSAGVVRQLATLAGTETLTNKTLTSPVINSPTGLVKGDVGLANVDNTSDATKNSAVATLTNKTLTSPVINSPTGLVKGDVGLGNVDNTSDATKNTATATLTNKTLSAPVINGGQFDFETFTDQSATPATPGTGKTIVFTQGKALMIVDSTGAVRQLATLTGTETLTNKTLTNPVINGATGITKADVGLGNVDNTSDATKNAAVATLTNKTLTSPVINNPTGLTKSDVGLGNVDNTSDATKNSATATLTNKTLTSPVINSPTGLVKADVGLGNVDNTSDATKNSATATLTNKTLTTPIIDVVQHADLGAVPATPASGKTLIYSRNNVFYRLGFDGVESVLGGSGSSGIGGKNYLSLLYDGLTTNGIALYNASGVATGTVSFVNTVNSFIFTDSAINALGTGQSVTYTTTGTAIGGLTSGNVYQVIRMQSNGFALAASLSDALNRNRIILTTSGSGTHSFTPVASTAAPYAAGAMAADSGAGGGIGTGITVAVNQNGPLRASSQRFSKDAANRVGFGWSYEFQADKADYITGQLMKITFSYQTSANYAGDVLIGMQGTQTLQPIQVSSAYGDVLAASTSPGRYTGYFFTNPNDVGYRLTMTVNAQTALAWTLDVDDFAITSASGTVPGAFSTTFQNFGAIAIGATTTAPTKGTVANDSIGYARVGDHALIKFEFKQTAAGTSGSGDYLFTLPNGLQFDSSKVSYFTTVVGTGSSVTQVGLGSFLASDGAGNSQVAGSIIPYDATRFRIAGVLTLNNGSGYNRCCIGSGGVPLGGASISYGGQFLAPILGWAASATYSTNEMLLKNVPTSATSSVKTGTLTAAYMLMTGNAMTLQPGTYDLGGTVDFNNSGTSPAYTNLIMGYYAANGADSTTAPAALTTISGLTIRGGAPTLNQPMTGAIATLQAPELTISLTQAATIYLVPAATATTIANARVTAYALANKRPDYSTFGVYGQFDLRTVTSSVLTPSVSGFHTMTNNFIDLPVGTFRLTPTTQFADSGTAASYNFIGVGAFAANGGNVTTVPALVSTLPNVNILSAHPPYQVTIASGSFNYIAGFMMIVRVTTGTARIYSVPYSAQTTAANARITTYMTAERLQ